MRVAGQTQEGFNYNIHPMYKISKQKSMNILVLVYANIRTEHKLEMSAVASQLVLGYTASVVDASQLLLLLMLLLRMDFLFALILYK
jgi:hypothetical protein